MTPSELLRWAALERDLLQKLPATTAIKDPALNFEQLLSLSESVERSLYIGTGGVLFELYILRLGKPRHVTFLQKELSNVGQLGTRNSFMISELIKDYGLPFWFYIISALPCVNQKCNYQLERLTMSLEYRGLSRFGLQILACLNAALNPRTYDRKRNKMLVVYDDMNMKFILDNKVILCFDNYNHFYTHATISLNAMSNLSLANYTVIGLSYLLKPVNNTILRYLTQLHSHSLLVILIMETL